MFAGLVLLLFVTLLQTETLIIVLLVSSYYSSFLSLLNQKSIILENEAKNAPIIIFNKSLNLSSNSNVG